MPEVAAQEAPDVPATISSQKSPATPPNGEPEHPAPNAKTRTTRVTAADRFPVPDWVHDARWYYIDVPRFRNGDRSNDGPGAPPWGTRRSDVGFPRDQSLYGGDLQGVRQKLPYLQALGINALILDGVFPTGVQVDGRSQLPMDDPLRILEALHVRDCVAVKGSVMKVGGEALDPATWKWTESDRLFLTLISEAQKLGIRVVAVYPISGARNQGCLGDAPNLFDFCAFIWDMNRHWLRAQKNGEERPGLDGWAQNSIYPSSRPGVLDRWRNKIKAVNRMATLIVFDQSFLSEDRLVPGIHCDAAVYTVPSAAVVNLFHRSHSPDIAQFLRDIPTTREKWPDCATPAGLVAEPRWPYCLSFRLDHGGPMDSSIGSAMSPSMIDRWRLAMVTQMLSGHDSALRFGEEVGVVQGGPPWYPTPMWWNDIPDPKTESPDYRGDFFALIQWLHKMRAQHRPLRRGDFRLVFSDAKNKVFSFARTLPGDEVILVMNYGDTKQKVMLPAGKPGQMVVALTPMIDPSKSRLARMTKGKYDHTRIEPLPVGGGLAFVNKDGNVRLWVDPMSIRVVLVNDKEPRRE